MSYASSQDRRNDLIQINKLTALLCTACGLLGANQVQVPVPDQLFQWWQAHEMADQQRKQKESQAKIAHKAYLIAKKSEIDLELASLDK